MLAPDSITRAGIGISDGSLTCSFVLATCRSSFRHRCVAGEVHSPTFHPEAIINDCGGDARELFCGVPALCYVGRRQLDNFAATLCRQ